MTIEVLRNGKFTFQFDQNHLTKGLRRSDRQERDGYGMTDLSGMIGVDGGFATIPMPTTVFDTGNPGAYPFPQVFVLSRLVLYCTQTKIFEMNYATRALTEKITVTAGGLWSVVDFVTVVYLSNGVVSVYKDADSGVYTLGAEPLRFPVANAICNYNGQVIVGGATSTHG
jgi:hypothetical protein